MLLKKNESLMNDVENFCHKIRERIVNQKVDEANREFSMAAQDLFERLNIVLMELLLYT